MEIEAVSYIQSPYPTKFGVPRQPGLVDALMSSVTVSRAYFEEVLPGTEAGDYIWLLWSFSHNRRGAGTWSRTIRPPRLGGSERVGVFASRSSFRPNELAISPVRVREIEEHGDLVVLWLVGADLVDGTPVYEMRPYRAGDSQPMAACGWVTGNGWPLLERVEYRPGEEAKIDPELKRGVEQVLLQDPRPAYTRKGQEARIFWVPLADLAVHFSVEGKTVTVHRVDRLDSAQLAELGKTGSITAYARERKQK